MSDFELRLQGVEDRLELIELEASYARSFDERDGETWSSLFTPEGIYQSRPEGGAPPATYVSGCSALRSFCDTAPFDGIHLMHLPQLTIDGDHATGRIHLQFHGSFPAEAGSPRRTTIGFYDVIYKRVDRVWKIAHRITTAFSRDQSTVIGYRAPAL